jgi:carbon monoxide dehydrogenase subunit G
MLRSRWLIVVAGIVTTLSLSGCDAIMGYFRAQREATKWEGAVEEIAFAKLEKDGKVFDIELHSRIDAPVDKVWAALKEPEKLSSMSEQYKKSDLLASEGNTKQLELHVLTLGNLQQFKVELTFHDDTKTVDIKTLQSTIADIDGSYHLEASPDGQKTLYIYKAKQTDKVNLPVSTDVQRSAIKESFVSQVNAIKKQIGAA